MLEDVRFMISGLRLLQQFRRHAEVVRGLGQTCVRGEQDSLRGETHGQMERIQRSQRHDEPPHPIPRDLIVCRVDRRRS